MQANNSKYINSTKSGKYRVCFPESIKKPRRLGVFPTLQNAQEARDSYLNNHGFIEQMSPGDNIITGKGNVIVGLYDLHVPYHHKKALSIACQIIQDVKPNDVVFGGDVVDFFQLSRFNNDTSRAKTTQEELNDWYDVAKQVKDCAKDATFYHLIGNHESRLHSWLCANGNGGLLSLDALKLPKLLRLDELGIESGREVHYLGSKLIMIHGRFYSINSGSAVKSEIKRRGWQSSICQGHEHRLSEYRQVGQLYDVVGISAGCLCVNSWYNDDFCNWQRGIVVVTIDGDTFSVENVKIGEKAIFRGKIYKS